MNQFWLAFFCVTAFVASAISVDVICNAGRGLQTYAPDPSYVTCYTAVRNQNPQEFKCPWNRCTQASGQNCIVNNHKWNDPTVSFTCDKDYVLNPGVGEQIGCDVNADYARKCPGGNGKDCIASGSDSGSHSATCVKINVHSHCGGCVAF
ncbi:uncharacterized protein MELLADRAFT_103893 [Melampsora larici-populina 98AG31]|uniref:Secreted protein n=1 Tax=Melampsora larici-populina (strain 98AG31 / pathotype 3-4-7) TaxID=747676 RepID=F4RCW9_MELLP|nr:uncharacterized protein MELLADRAFT_103893 [Melampsora larici-populina 98AG31]EGG09798.1 secreted protein [Melampsora larici-populina 98AG31]